MQLVVTVDPSRPRLQLVRDTECSLNILREDRRSQTVLGIVGQLDDFLLSLELDERHDGSEDLFRADFHLRGHVGENGGFDEVSFVSFAISAGQTGRTVILAALHVSKNLIELSLIDLRSLEGVRSEGVADLESLDVRDEFFDEFVVNALLDEDSRAGTAALPRSVHKNQTQQ